MIYWLFPRLNPLLPTLLLCPILAILIGVCFASFKGKIYLGLILAFLLPLIFIATNLETIAVNIDAWILYGFIYAIITFVAYKMAFSQLVKSS